MTDVKENGKTPEEIRQIVILGFADSRVQAPFADQSWEIWGCNDVYAHTPRVDVVFEVHHTLNLGHRRNPQHEQVLRSGQKPIWMIPGTDISQFPTARHVPVDEVVGKFPRAYITNSISWMLAMAIMDITGEGSWLPEDRKGKPMKGRIGIFGVDMAATTEYAGQRASCEYFVGIADGLGIDVHIPADSDLCKANVLYGLGTTAPLAIKLQSRMEHLRQAKIQYMAQLQQKQAEISAIQSQLDSARGQVAALEYVKGVWTMATDIPLGAKAEPKDRSLKTSELPVAPLSEVPKELLELTGGVPSQT